MSEKRYYMEDGVLKDGATGEAVSLYGIDDLLNEQQATISALKEENEQLRKQLDFYLLDEFEWKEKYGDVLDE